MRRHRSSFAALLGAALSLVWGSAALADPITIASWAVATFTSLTGAAAVAATFVVATAVAAAEYGIAKLFSPKATASAAQRQAAVVQLQLGEAPRQVIFGLAGTGGSLADAFNTGGEHGTDWEYLAVCLASHPCESLEGVWVNDAYVDLRGHSGDGVVAGYNNQLVIHYRSADDATPDFPSSFAGMSPATEPGSLKGETKVLVGYRADMPDDQTPTWMGRPSFTWVVKGKRCYDPRLDSTVPGGSGPHRWADPSTWEWSENAEICRYNFDRGVYALDQVGEPGMLWVGRGLSAIEAPPEAIFAAANLCDELVAANDGGGTEPRYRVGGVINADEEFGGVAEMFAAAVAGVIIQPEGGVRVEPGQAKAPVAAITPGDLLVGSRTRRVDFKPANDRVNMVVPTYPEPSQKWTMTAGDIVRDDADVLADGAQRPLSLSFALVPFKSQVHRLCGIQYRQARLERSRTITVVPMLAGGECAAALEEGDWVTYPLDDTDPESDVLTWRVTGYALDEAECSTLTLQEVTAAVYGFGGYASPATSSPAPTPPDALALSGVTAEAVTLEGEDGSIIPAVRFGWATPTDPAILRIRAEVRRFEEVVAAQSITDAPAAGEMIVTNGVPPAAAIEVRLVPMGGPGRIIAPTAWMPLVTVGFLAPGGDYTEVRDAILEIGGRGANLAARVRDQFDRLLAHLDTLAIGAVQDSVDAQRRRAEEKARTLVNGVPVVAFAENERVERIEGQTALAADITLLDAEVGANHAEALLAYAAFANADSAQAEAQLALTAVVGANHAAALLAVNTVANNLSTQAGLLAALRTEFNSNEALVALQLSALSNADGATAEALFVLQTMVDGHQSALTVYGAAINGLSAEWGFALNVDGAVAGLHSRLFGDRSNIDFLFNVVRFIDPGTGTAFPWLVYESGQTRLNGNVYVQKLIANSIETDWVKIGALWTTVVSQTNSFIGVDSTTDVELVGAGMVASGDVIQALFVGTVVSPSSRMHTYLQLKRNGAPIGQPVHISLDGEDIIPVAIPFIDVDAEAGAVNYYSVAKISGNCGFEGRSLAVSNIKRSA